MEYFEVPEANPGQDGICSDNDCPCGYPGAKIPRGTGYMYISKAVVDFRKDARTVRDAEIKMDLMRKQMGAFIMFDQNTVSPTLMCEQGARKRGLDLAVAGADAKYWWETGLAPLRETPLAGNLAAKAVVQQPVQIKPSQPIIKASEPATNVRKHSGCLTAFLALAVVGNALLAVITWAMVSDVSSSMQPIVIFAGLLNLAGVGFAIAVYKWKKWGVYGYVVVIGITMLLNLVLGDIASALRGIIPIALLLSLIRSSWKQME